MAGRKKGIVFRVRGLPSSGSDDEIIKALKDAIEENVTEDEKSKLITNASIVPSCYHNNKKTGLVEFCGGVPAFLAELVSNPLGDFQVEMGDTDINFDRHFFGFTQLYTPQSGSPINAECIVVFPVEVYV